VTLLAVRDLTIAYRDSLGIERIAVEGARFDLDPGETLGIVGESGSGKSTLARALLGYGRPGSRFVGGSVHLDGRDLVAMPAEELRRMRGRRVALVPQNPLQALTPHMTIGAQIAEVLARHRGIADRRERAAMVAGLLRAMQVDDPEAVAGRYPHEVSGGQRQRAVIAAALAGEPAVLVLDEPTTALDKSTEIQVLALLRELRGRIGCALILVSHDLRMIGSICDRVLVMLSGHVVEQGPTSRILSAPRERYTRDLVSALPAFVPGPARATALSPPLLVARDLGLVYRRPGWGGLARRDRGRAALRDVGFALAKGRTLGVVGESGSGKSTLGGLVTGLLAGHDGDMRFDGIALEGAARRRAPALRQRIQMVFQDPTGSLNPRHAVGRIVARGFEVHGGLAAGEARTQAAILLERMGIDGKLMSRLPGELSGGQQQRVAIARAFAARPDLVVCDEITSALDVTVQAQVLALMRDLQEKDGVAYLFISHDLAVVSEMADDVLVLRAGAPTDLHSTAAIHAGAGSAYARALIAAFEQRGAHATTATAVTHPDMSTVPAQAAR